MAAQRAGRPITARDAYLRAHNYFRTAQFFLLGSDARKKDSYVRCVQNFHAALPYFDNPPERVTFPFEGSHLSGYYYRPLGAARQRHPAIAYLGGVDIISEELYFFAAQQMLQRGFGVLCFDGPGHGRAAARARHPRATRLRGRDQRGGRLSQRAVPTSTRTRSA